MSEGTPKQSCRYKRGLDIPPRKLKILRRVLLFYVVMFFFVLLMFIIRNQPPERLPADEPPRGNLR